MSIEITIPEEYRKYTDNHASATVSGGTVGECLEDLALKYPGLRRALLDNHARLHPYLDIHINGESVYPDQLEKPVRDGDRLEIIMVICGP